MTQAVSNREIFYQGSVIMVIFPFPSKIRVKWTLNRETNKSKEQSHIQRLEQIYKIFYVNHI